MACSAAILAPGKGSCDSTRTTAIRAIPGATTRGCTRGRTVTISPRTVTVRARNATPASRGSRKSSFSGRSHAQTITRGNSASGSRRGRYARATRPVAANASIRIRTAILLSLVNLDPLSVSCPPCHALCPQQHANIVRAHPRLVSVIALNESNPLRLFHQAQRVPCRRIKHEGCHILMRQWRHIRRREIRNFPYPHSMPHISIFRFAQRRRQGKRRCHFSAGNMCFQVVCSLGVQLGEISEREIVLQRKWVRRINEISRDECRSKRRRRRHPPPHPTPPQCSRKCGVQNGEHRHEITLQHGSPEHRHQHHVHRDQQSRQAPCTRPECSLSQCHNRRHRTYPMSRSNQQVVKTPHQCQRQPHRVERIPKVILRERRIAE